MGSSQSQPSRPTTRSRSPHPPRPTLAPSTSTSTSNSPSRFQSLRRLSTFGRRESQKRDRAGSSATSLDGDQKKRRVDTSDADSATPSRSPGAAFPLQHGSLPTSPGPPVLPIVSPPYPQPSPLSPSLSPSADPLFPDRLRMLSTIQDTLGPEWPTATVNPAVAHDRLRQVTTSGPARQLRRQSMPTASSSSSAAPAPPRLADRFCSLLGITPSTPLAGPTEPSEEEVSISELTERMSEARTDLEQTQRDLEAANATLRRTEEAARAAREQAEGAGGGTERIPAGAVLVIQGLAQTHALERAAQNTDSGQGSRNPRPSMGRQRSSSESHAQGNRPGQAEESGEANSDDSLETQARMISGLLTVAAAATATTLLSPNTISSPAPAPPSNPISSFLDRFRSHRRSAPTVEAALGAYLRNALRERRRVDDDHSAISGTTASSADSTSTDVTNNISDDFQRFLEGLQTDLVGAVRQFAAVSDEQAGDEPAEPNSSAPRSEASESIREDSMDVEMPNFDSTATTLPAANISTTSSDGETPTEAGEGATPIPAFHYQLGQNRSDAPSRRFGVSGGTEGQPRRLNFFRAHLFPPVRSNEPATTTGTDDPDGMVPCIFIGVRSLAHDPTMTTDDLVQHPNFPFTDGQVPVNNETTTSDAASTASSSSLNDELPAPVTPFEQPSAPASSPTQSGDRRTLRERVLDRLNPRRTPRSMSGPLNTYLVYVIGGYYPRSHPVLSIPNLVTGDPLTDEEMALVSELMGPGKPPTATQDDIEKSGLTVVDSSEIAKLGEQGVILENCVERCLVCLGDYEEGEQCRVLKCRHAFHKECVDEWLSKGRNSCPTCRTEAVETKTNPAAAPAETAGLA